MSQSLPRVIVVQPVVPSYRISFFDSASNLLGDRFEVHASDLNMGVLTGNAKVETWRRTLGPILRLGPGIEWQRGALLVPIKRHDLVVISGAPRCITNMLLLVKARMLGAHTIWWGQLWSATSRWHRFGLRLLLMRLAHSVLFYTDVEVSEYKSRFGRWDQRQFGALNNGIDIKPIEVRREVYVAERRDNEILFIGRLTDKAQISLLLEAMTKDPLVNATLHIIGDGPDRSWLQNWANNNGLISRVIWHGGTIDENKIASVANRSAIFCYPGGVGLSLVHAMAYGLPSVVHNDKVTHMPEIAAFEHGATGFSFSKGDVQSLAQTLGSLLVDHVARNNMSKEAIQRTRELYNTDMMAFRFVEMLGPTN